MYKSIITGMRAVVALLLLVSVQAWAVDGQVKTVSGGAFVNTTPAIVGTKVNSGDTLSTGPGAWIIVVMSDGTVLNLKSDTKVEVSNYVYNTADPSRNASDVEIGIGTLRYVSGLIAQNDPSDVAIRAGNTTLGLRGSESETNFDGSTVTTKVISGNWTSTNGGNTYNAGPGQEMNVDDETGEGETNNTPPGQEPSNDQGGDETGNLGKQDPGNRGPGGPGTGETGQAGDQGGKKKGPPPPASKQSPVYSDDPASTSDPNAGG